MAPHFSLMRDRQPTLLEDRSMNLRLTTMTAAVALMFFTPIASYAQDTPPAPPGTAAPSAVDTKSDTYTQQKLGSDARADRALPRSACVANSNGFDLSAADRPGGTL